MSADRPVCWFCEMAQTKCFYAGLPPSELRQIQDNEISANCPNFPDLIAEPTLAMIVPSDLPPVTSLIVHDTPKPTLAPNIIVLPIESNGNGEKKKKRKYEKKAKTSNVPIGFREYFDTTELMNAAGVPQHLRAPFETIAEAIDRTGNYPIELSGAKRKAYSDKINLIILANDIREDEIEFTQFILVLWSSVRTWTNNTRGKTREEIEPFVFKK